MDYLEFAERVLERYIQAGFDRRPYVLLTQLASELSMPDRPQSLYNVVDDLSRVGVFDLNQTVIKPNNNTDRVRHGATLRSAWPQFFEGFLTPEQEQFLAKAVELAHRPSEDHADMEMVAASDVYDALAWESLEDPDAYRLCDALENFGLILQWKAMSYSITLRPRYAGFVRATQRVASEWQAKLAELLAEGETTTVDMKRELTLGSKRQKGEFVRDVLGLATTKASGRDRYLVIGFDDDTRNFVQSVDPAITREQLEQIVNAYTDPKPEVDWITVPIGGGTAGIVVVRRDPTKVPYRLSRDVSTLRAGSVYVRHGTHTEAPTAAELAALEAEGSRARGE